MYNYSKIWMSLLERDLKRLEKQLEYLKVEEQTNVFACIVTGRSWEAINEGIMQVKYSDEEGKSIRREAPKYLRQISHVLNKIPREMLLLLKTNDLLRGIEVSLGTRSSSSLFFHMSLCCVQMINSYERECFYKSYLVKQQDTNANTQRKLKLLFDLVCFNLASYANQFLDFVKVCTFQFFIMLSFSVFEDKGIGFSIKTVGNQNQVHIELQPKEITNESKESENIS